MCLNDFCPNFFTVVVPFYSPTSNVGELLVALLVWQTWLYLIFLILSVQHTCNPLSFIVFFFFLYLPDEWCWDFFHVPFIYLLSEVSIQNFCPFKIRLVIFLWLNYSKFFYISWIQGFFHIRTRIYILKYIYLCVYIYRHTHTYIFYFLNGVLWKVENINLMESNLLFWFLCFITDVLQKSLFCFNF